MANDNGMATIERVELRLKKLESNVERVESKLERVESKVERVEQMIEKIGDDIKKLGEGYEDGMRRLSTEMKKINRRWDEKWSPHDLAIKDHGKRITALEQRHK